MLAGRRVTNQREAANSRHPFPSMSSFRAIQPPTIGRIVQIALSASVAEMINGRLWPNVIRSVSAGELFPLIVTRVWPAEMYQDNLVINGQIVLDGPGHLWVSTVHFGNNPGEWRWPDHSALAPAQAPLKNHSGKIAADMASPKVRAAIQAEANPAVLHDRIAQLTAEVQELNALLIDRTAEAAQLADRAKRAEEERDRRRAAENKLISDRDRLIHVDIAGLNKEILELKTELESSRQARKIYSDQANKAAEELSACMERERRLTERLAKIAGIVSDL